VISVTLFFHIHSTNQTNSITASILRFDKLKLVWKINMRISVPDQNLLYCSLYEVSMDLINNFNKVPWLVQLVPASILKTLF